MIFFSAKTSDLLVDVFNNNIYSSKTSKRVNYSIIFLIVIATLEIILGTEHGLVDVYPLLGVIYYTTSIIFLVEIVLRFIISKRINPKYGGLRGKFSFATEFYNLIDIISILPFILGFVGIELFPFLKALRVFRILKIMRYLPSVGLLQDSIKNRRNELIISLQLIFILAILISIGLYYAESGVQGSQFTSISQSLLWSIAKFIGDIGGYGDFLPLTILGKILATLNGILGIAIFALPAGIIGSGFVEEMENEKIKKKQILQEARLKQAFFIEYFAPVIKKKKSLNLSHFPRKWLSIDDIKYKLGISETSVLDVVEFSNLFRLRNVKLNGMDQAGLEYISLNSSYGQCINRNSKLTIVNLYSSLQPYFGHFSMAVADLLQANYISNEVFSTVSFREEKQLAVNVNESYVNGADSHPALTELKKDLKKLIGKDQNCLFLVNAGAGSNENLMQFNIGAEIGDDSFENGPFFSDKQEITSVFNLANEMAMKSEMKALKHGTVGKPHPNHISWYIKKETNCNLLMLHVNVGILKKKGAEYYQYIEDFSRVFSGLS